MVALPTSDARQGGFLPLDASADGSAIDRLLIAEHLFLALLLAAGLALFTAALLRPRALGHLAKELTGPLAGRLALGAAALTVAVELALEVFGSAPAFARLRDPDDPPGALHLRVVAAQFAWKVHYPGADGRYGRRLPAASGQDDPLRLDPSDEDGRDDAVALNALHVPVGTPVRIDLSSEDVVHAFHAPLLRVKQDAIPGQRARVAFTAVLPGRYDLVCAQLCGLAHYRMKGVVVAESPAEFAAWLAARANGRAR